jgi:hypothetical protein
MIKFIEFLTGFLGSKSSTAVPTLETDPKEVKLITLEINQELLQDRLISRSSCTVATLLIYQLKMITEALKSNQASRVRCYQKKLNDFILFSINSTKKIVSLDSFVLYVDPDTVDDGGFTFTVQDNLIRSEWAITFNYDFTVHIFNLTYNKLDSDPSLDLASKDRLALHHDLVYNLSNLEVKVLN